MTQSQDRVCEAKELRATVIPILSLLIKDHNELNEKGLPKSRPVCGASTSIIGELSEWISQILDAVSQSLESDEVISSEELLAFVDEVNELLGEKGLPEEGLCVGSLDVKALYPSLVIKECAKLCREVFLESPVELEDIDPRWAAIYVALNLKPHEIIRVTTPMRRISLDSHQSI